jgi:hypothetical protein
MERHEYVVQGNLDLASGNLVRIEDGRGMLVRVTRGSVWITEEGDQRDRLVGPGGQFRVVSSGVTLISAVSRSSIALSSPYEHGFARRIDLVRANLLARMRARLMKRWKGLYVPGARPTTASL